MADDKLLKQAAPWVLGRSLCTIVLSMMFMTCPQQSNASDDAYFGCDASGRDTCYFRIFYESGSKGTEKIFAVRSPITVRISNLSFDRDMYCMEVEKLPSDTCQRKRVNSNFNK